MFESTLISGIPCSWQRDDVQEARHRSLPGARDPTDQGGLEHEAGRVGWSLQDRPGGQGAVTSFLYIGSSQLSAKMQSRACLLSRALAASRRPLARPSPISACLSTSWMAVLMSMGPEA